MQLEEYWGIGPKTKAQLERELGEESARRAIETIDLQAIVSAGIPRGRATQILRRAKSDRGMEVLATKDTRLVYKELVERASSFAVTQHAADHIRVMTPLRSADAIEDQLDRIDRAVETWRELTDDQRDGVIDSFAVHNSIGDPGLAAVETILALRDVGVTDGVFDRFASYDPEMLQDVSTALRHLEGESVQEGADSELDALRETLHELEDKENQSLDILEELRSAGVTDVDALQAGLVEYLDRETGVTRDVIRRSLPEEAIDASDFVSSTLRSLREEYEHKVESTEQRVKSDLESDLSVAAETVDDLVATVRDVAVTVSLARFAMANDLNRPTIVSEDEVLAVRDARSLSLIAEDDNVQPISYGVGHHSVNDIPADDLVAVLTGANSGGKTTLLETLCQIAILAQMGLPVPAESVETSVFDSIVFHRRHASFNAGVLEATLKTIVPPLASGGRTVMLVDEFEAITEPGSAAELLHGLVTLTVDRGLIGVFVTHLADDLQPLPETARLDGIFAEGLDESLNLQVDYQPRFGVIGRSTPEFIVSRLIANASNRTERAAFEKLAEALGADLVQKTLSESPWTTEE